MQHKDSWQLKLRKPKIPFPVRWIYSNVSNLIYKSRKRVFYAAREVRFHREREPAKPYTNKRWFLRTCLLECFLVKVQMNFVKLSLGCSWADTSFIYSTSCLCFFATHVWFFIVSNIRVWAPPGTSKSFLSRWRYSNILFFALPWGILRKRIWERIWFELVLSQFSEQLQICYLLAIGLMWQQSSSSFVTRLTENSRYMKWLIFWQRCCLCATMLSHWSFWQRSANKNLNLKMYV